ADEDIGVGKNISEPMDGVEISRSPKEEICDQEDGIVVDDASGIEKPFVWIKSRVAEEQIDLSNPEQFSVSYFDHYLERLPSFEQPLISMINDPFHHLIEAWPIPGRFTCTSLLGRLHRSP
ncbi:MAG: hypothetical protein ACK55I_37480, partial [bacterium]